MATAVDTGVPRPQAARHRRQLPLHRPQLHHLAAALLLVAFVAPVADLVRHWNGGWMPAGDDAVTEHVVRQVGHHLVELGSYSRFGWHHPGPALFYLLAVPYRVLGGSSASLPLGAMLVNAVCLVLIALLVRRHLGPAAAVGAAIVLLVYVRRLEPGFLREVWNPYVALLPFTLLIVVSCSIVLGDRRLLPAAVGLGSFCVQCHVGYAIGVAVLWAGTAVGIALGLGGVRLRPVRPWLLPALLSSVVLAFFWTLPVVEQVTGHPGNITLLVDYFRAQHGDLPVTEAVRQLQTTLGWLPGWVTGQHYRSNFPSPALLPSWTGAVAVLAYVGAMALAVRMRDRPAVVFGAFVAVLALGSVFAQTRVVGPLFPYLVQWIWSVGVGLWVFVGVVLARLVGRVVARADRGDERRERLRRPVGVASACVSLVVLLALSLGVGHRVAADPAGSIPQMRVLADAATRWLVPYRGQPITVEFAPALKPSLVGTSPGGTAMVLALERAGFDVQLPDRDRIVWGTAVTSHLARARATITVGFSNGGSPPPEPGNQVLGSAGEYEVYAKRR